MSLTGSAGKTMDWNQTDDFAFNIECICRICLSDLLASIRREARGDQTAKRTVSALPTRGSLPEISPSHTTRRFPRLNESAGRSGMIFIRSVGLGLRLFFPCTGTHSPMCINNIITLANCEGMKVF